MTDFWSQRWDFFQFWIQKSHEVRRFKFVIFEDFFRFFPIFSDFSDFFRFFSYFSDFPIFSNFSWIPKLSLNFDIQDSGFRILIWILSESLFYIQLLKSESCSTFWILLNRKYSTVWATRSTKYIRLYWKIISTPLMY